MKNLLLLTTMLFSSGAAFAQSVGPASAAPEQDAASASENQDISGLQDIIVTASRRSESLQKSSLVIQALDAESLTKANVTQPESLNKLIPGVTIGAAGATPMTYIRGVGNYSTNNYAEGAVAYNLDGVYISRQWALRGHFFDLERVEVLKGPQGTLYGRNASGGAINLITRKPNFDLGGYAEVEVGNYDLTRASGALNLPLGDIVAVRAAFQTVNRNGYLSDGYDDEKSRSGRVQLLVEPSDALSLNVGFNVSQTNGRGGSGVPMPNLPGENPWLGIADPASGVHAIILAQPVLGSQILRPSQDGFTNIDVWGVHAELAYDFGPATFTLIPAYRKSTLSLRTYTPGFQVNNDEEDHQTSIEARLGNQSDQLKWVLGGYYFKETQKTLNNKPLTFVNRGFSTFSHVNPDNDTTSYAVFGEATAGVSEGLRLIAGGRYSREKKSQEGQILSPPSAPIELAQKLSFEAFTWKLGAEFDVSPDSLLFLTVSRGFKAGGFFAAAAPEQYKPEKLTAFTLGAKNRFFDNKLQVNGDLFYWKYKDHQESHLGLTRSGVRTFVTENAGEATIYGASVDITYRATRSDQITLAAEYLKSKYDSFVFSFPGVPNTGCVLGPFVNGSSQIDCSGRQLVRAPEWSIQAGYQHTFDFSSGGTLVADLHAQYSSAYDTSIDFLPRGRQGAYVVSDFDLTYYAPDEKWSLSAYVHNITEEAVYTQSLLYPFVTQANPLMPEGLLLASIRPPRTFGARLRVNF